MQHGQVIMKAALKQMLRPSQWLRLPFVLAALSRSVDTDLPAWLWPRLVFALLLSGPDGIDNRTITREMVTPFTTSEGANVLLPNWGLINPVLLDMFGQ
jgi:anionic cell wall polymer biosynthesis LytR-Cps2A-Psr (LCP) family protein